MCCLLRVDLDELSLIAALRYGHTQGTHLLFGESDGYGHGPGLRLIHEEGAVGETSLPPENLSHFDGRPEAPEGLSSLWAKPKSLLR
ncbi:hypothetical protein SAMN05444004_106169 [Jannaschia faecimaris]|uniref:Uncharacterized protein n=1 Tax=Jannaschia faecimaris TaxID=1244108 RepID=A0A1H3QKH3_9RHOB|nr:hypothetical protein SAMN05444004_106169 [Jannaschia faecimaris]